jgi:two-component system, NtrC family, response regulator HydG
MRVLIVDDDVDLMSGYIDVLREAGHHVIGCSSFQEARGALKAGTFDAIVTDVRLGESNGLGLLFDADAFQPGLHKVVMSGYPDRVLRRDAEALGAVYLEKPFEPEALLNAIQSSSQAERGELTD